MASSAQAAGPRNGDFVMETQLHKQMIWFKNMTAEDAAKLRDMIKDTNRPLVQPNGLEQNYVCLLNANGPMTSDINVKIMTAAAELLGHGTLQKPGAGGNAERKA